MKQEFEYNHKKVFSIKIKKKKQEVRIKIKNDI